MYAYRIGVAFLTRSHSIAQASPKLTVTFRLNLVLRLQGQAEILSLHLLVKMYTSGIL